MQKLEKEVGSFYVLSYEVNQTECPLACFCVSSGFESIPRNSSSRPKHDLAPARTFLYMQQHSMNSNVTLVQKFRRKYHLLLLSACRAYRVPSAKERVSFYSSDTQSIFGHLTSSYTQVRVICVCSASLALSAFDYWCA